MMNTTTYREDYNSPFVKYFPIPPITFKVEPQALGNSRDCICDEQPRDNLHSREEKKHQEYDSYEWSRLGPMGSLLEPKLYGVNTNLSICANQKMKCGDNKNWMRALQESSSLKKVTSPYHDMLRIIHEDRLKSTYQVDYDHLVEYPNICYDEEFPLEIKEEIRCREPVKPPFLGGHDLPGRPPRSKPFPPVPELPVKVVHEEPRVKGSKPKDSGGAKLKGPQKANGKPGKLKLNVLNEEGKQLGAPMNVQMNEMQQKTHEKSKPKNYQGNLNNQPPNKKPWATTYCEVYCHPADKIMKDQCLCTAEKSDEDNK